MTYIVTLPRTQPTSTSGGKGEISFHTNAQTLDEFVSEVLARYISRDTEDSLKSRAKHAWEWRKAKG